MFNKDFWTAFFSSNFWGSPFCLGILSLAFVSYLIHAVVVPIVHVVSDTIPTKMDVVISKQDAIIRKLDENLSERISVVPIRRKSYVK